MMELTQFSAADFILTFCLRFEMSNLVRRHLSLYAAVSWASSVDFSKIIFSTLQGDTSG